MIAKHVCIDDNAAGSENYEAVYGNPARGERGFQWVTLRYAAGLFSVSGSVTVRIQLVLRVQRCLLS